MNSQDVTQTLPAPGKHLPGSPVPLFLFRMASVVYLTNRAPAKLIGDLILAGHRAWECLSVSETLYICEREWIDAIVIAPDIEDPDFAEAQLHHFTIQLRPEATAKELIWELSQLFPGKAATIQ